MTAKKNVEPEPEPAADYPAHDNLEAPPDRPADWEQPLVAPPEEVEEEGEGALPGEADETVEYVDEPVEGDDSY